MGGGRGRAESRSGPFSAGEGSWPHGLAIGFPGDALVPVAYQRDVMGCKAVDLCRCVAKLGGDDIRWTSDAESLKSAGDGEFQDGVNVRSRTKVTACALQRNTCETCTAKEGRL